MVPEKLEAIARGDLSGRNVNPFFIHIAHLFGCVYYRDDSGERVPSDLQEGYHHIVNQALENHDNFTPMESLQAYILIGSYQFLTNQWSAACDYGREKYGAIVDNNLHIKIPSTESIASFARQGPLHKKYGCLAAIDEEDEQRSLLCFVVQCDYLGIMMWSTPVVLPQYLDEEFQAFAVVPFLVRTCIVFSNPLTASDAGFARRSNSHSDQPEHQQLAAASCAFFRRSGNSCTT